MSILSGIFKQKVSSYLGVDLGTGSIKVVELENVASRPRLVTYGLVEVETNVSRDDARGEQKQIAAIFKSLLEKSHARSRLAVAALPNFSVFSSVISLPELGPKELAEAIQWEAKKFVPMPIENVVLDWKILDKPATSAKDKKIDPAVGIIGSEVAGKKVMRVLLTAAPKHLVERYVAIFKLAGVSLLSLETESFALGRSLVGNDPAPILIADIGSLTTDLTVIEAGVPVLARSIDVGGNTVTRAIASSMGIDQARAEQFKRDVGLGAPDAKGTGVGAMIENSFAAVVNEMKYSLGLYQGQGNNKIEKILLTGGNSFLPGLPEFLTQSLGVKVFVANPWARVSYPKDLSDILDQLSPRMATPIGLAMREII